MFKKKIELHSYVTRSELLTILMDLKWIAHINRHSMIIRLWIGYHIKQVLNMLQDCHDFIYERVSKLDKIKAIINQHNV